MISLEEASKEISDVISQLEPKLKSKYLNVEHRKGYISCTNRHGDVLTLQAIPDSSRRTLRLPRNGKEYQEQGGHKGLHDKFIQHNPDAWKIKVVNSTSSSKYEIAFLGSSDEYNWDAKKFEKEFIRLFLDRNR